MKPVVFTAKGAKSAKKTGVPAQFQEAYNPVLIKRAVLAEQSLERQPQGRDPKAGLKHSTMWHKRRQKKWRTTYNQGISRTPKKILARIGGGWQGVMRFKMFRGAEAPQTVKGRRAHPPTSEKIIVRKINKKEHEKAIRSAMNATTQIELVQKRGHKTQEAFIILEAPAEKISKTSELVKLLEKIGLRQELERSQKKTIKAGRGKTRGRKYKKTVGPLIITSGEEADLNKSAKNIPGIEAIPVTNLQVQKLAPGTIPGRLTIWTETALEKMEKEGLYA